MFCLRLVVLLQQEFTQPANGFFPGSGLSTWAGQAKLDDAA